MNLKSTVLLVCVAVIVTACGEGEETPGDAVDTTSRQSQGAPARGDRFGRAAVWAIINEPDPDLGNFKFARVSRFDPDLATRQATIAAESDPNERQTNINPIWMAVCGDNLYVTSYGGNSIEAIDLQSLEVTGRRSGDLADVACVGGDVWALDTSEMAAIRLSADVSNVEATVPFGPPPPSRMLAQGGQLWVIDMFSGVYRIDTAAEQAQEIRIRDDGRAYNLIGIAVVNDKVWVVGQAGPEKALLQVDAASGAVHRRVALAEGSEIGFLLGNKAKLLGAFGGVFIASPDGNGLVRLNPETGEVACTAPIEGAVTALAAGPDAVVVGTSEPGGLHEISPADCAVTASVALEGAVKAIAVSR